MQFNFFKFGFLLTTILIFQPLTVGCKTEKPFVATQKQDSENNREIISEKTPQILNPNEQTIEQKTKIEDFAPEGWHLMMKAEGDLNGDKIPDAAGVFSKAELFDGKDDAKHSTAQSEEDVNTPRVLIIALASADGNFDSSVESRKIILCRTCGAQLEDPFISLEIIKGVIELRQTALGTSEVDYLYKIKTDKNGKWSVFYQSAEITNRTNRKTRTYKNKKPILLEDFDIETETKNIIPN